MALRFVDSFDHYGTNNDMMARKYDYLKNPGDNSLSTDYGRNGTVGFRFGWGTIRKHLDNKEIWIVGFAFRHIWNNNQLLHFYDTDSSQIYFKATSDGKIQVYRGDNTLLGTTGQVFDSDITMRYFEFKVKINNTTGSVVIRVNEQEKLNLSNIDTQNTANAYANRIQIGGYFGIKIDDLYICDGDGTTNNDFLGDVRVCALFPNGADVSEWTPSAGANYECVDDNPANDDTDYVSSSTANQIDTYALSDLPAFTGDIKGVQALLCARKDDAGTRQIAQVIKPDATNHVGTTRELADNYTYYRELWENNPDTTNPWTISEINSLKAGVKMVS